MSPYLHLLPAALCALGALWQASEAAHEWRTLAARLTPDRGPFLQAATLAALAFAAAVIAMVPPIAHAIATGAAR